MPKISVKAQKWLKAFHIFFSCLWVGGAVSVTVMLFMLSADSGMELYGINKAINFIDIWIIIPGNSGIILTGILYSTLTNWGWFKHTWVTVKWIIAIYGLIFGILWLGPWAGGLETLAHDHGMEALDQSAYKNYMNMLYTWGTFQAATLVFASFISTLKPWKKKKSS